jgi:riboflavin synthase
MFTGIVECLATVHRIEADEAGRNLTVSAPVVAADAKVGDSIAVNGVCLTVVERDAVFLRFQIGPETLRCTNLGELTLGDSVNLERALRLNDRLSGHFVQGHVDGIGRIADRQRQGDWETVWFSCAADCTRSLVPKGSIAVDGVSLTVVDVTSDRFSVALIPHTLANTTLGFKPVGAAVNLEIDILAKYVAKHLTSAAPARRL